MGGLIKPQDKVDGEGKKEELVLQDTFAQETAVTIEDPNMYNFILFISIICIFYVCLKHEFEA